MIKNGWISLLNFEMTAIFKIENELNKEISGWIKATSSPNLLVILLKIQVYIQEHIRKMSYFLENKQISPITSHYNIVGIMTRELHEKLKYSSSQSEKEHCIMSNISATSCLKNNYYNNCHRISLQLEQDDAALFFKTAAEDEARVWKWTIDSLQPIKEIKRNHYLLL